MTRKFGRLGLCIIGTIAWQGCFAPVKYSGEIKTQEVSISYGDLALSGEVRNRWWEAFGDASLNEFIEIVLRENPTLQTAYLKLLDSMYAVKQAQAGYYPTLGFSAGVGGGGNIYTDPSAAPNYNLGLSLGYEVDLWGKVRAQTRVAELSRENASDDAETAAISLVATVVTHWFNVQYYRDRKALTEQLLAISNDYYELVESYYTAGQTTGMDVLEQRQQIETLRSTLHELDANIRISVHALEILAGGKATPRITGALPEAIDIGGTLAPDVLLENRPDVRSALRQAQSADARIVIALANRLPSLRLSVALNYRNSSIVDLFKTLLWDVGASFAATLFDGFNQTTEIDRAKITYLTQRLAYGSTVLEAVADVEKSLLDLQIAEQNLTDAKAQLERQTEILQVSREYFIGGSIDYNRVLSALRSMVSASQSELDARRQLLTAQIALFKSMGGASWTRELQESGLKKAREMLDSLDDADATAE